MQSGNSSGFFAVDAKNEQTVKNAGKEKKDCPNGGKCAIV
jgi:hypothetical protein